MPVKPESEGEDLRADVVPQLSRSLRPRHVSMITFGGIIGAGLFVGSSVAIAATGPLVVLSYAITGLIILVVMRSVGEMAVENPDVRSFTDFIRIAHGPRLGFVFGWLYWYFWVVTIPVEAIAGAVILHSWLPEVPSFPLGAGLMIALTVVNLMSARSYGEFEFWFASIKVAAIIAFIAICAAYLTGAVGPHAPVGEILHRHGGLLPKGFTPIISTVPMVFFAMIGAEVATIAAAESPDPARAVARMVSSVIWRILFFYVASISLIVCVVPWDSVVGGHSPFVLALETIKVPYAGEIMAVVILTAVLSCLNSAFYVSSRVLFVLAAHADAPRSLVSLDARRVPTRSVIIGCVAGFLGIAANAFAPAAVFSFLVSTVGALIVFIYIATCAAAVRLRYRRNREGLPAPALSVWCFPWLSYLAIAAMVAVLVAMALDQKTASQLYTTLFAIAVAFLAYSLAKRRQNTHATFAVRRHDHGT